MSKNPSGPKPARRQKQIRLLMRCWSPGCVVSCESGACTKHPYPQQAGQVER